MAVKQYLMINEDVDNEFTLKKTGADRENLSGGETRIAHKLFGANSSIRIKRSNHEEIGNAKKELLKYLMKEARNKYFILNSGYFTVGLILTGLTLAAVIAGSREIFVAAFMSIWLSGWTAGCFFIGLRAVKAWTNAPVSGVGRIFSRAGAIGATLFGLPFFGGEIFGLYMFSKAVSPLAAIALLVIILTVVTTDPPGTAAITGSHGIRPGLPLTWDHHFPEPSLQLPRLRDLRPAAEEAVPPAEGAAEGGAVVGSRQARIHLKKPFGPISLLVPRFKSSKYWSIPAG